MKKDLNKYTSSQVKLPSSKTLDLRVQNSPLKSKKLWFWVVTTIVVLAAISLYSATHNGWNWFLEIFMIWGIILLSFLIYQMGQLINRENKKIMSGNEQIGEAQRTAAILRLSRWSERTLSTLNTTYPMKQSLMTMTQTSVQPDAPTGLSAAFWQFDKTFRQMKTEGVAAVADSKIIGGHVAELVSRVNEQIAVLSDSFTKMVAPPLNLIPIDKLQGRIIKNLNEIVRVISIA